MKKLLYTFALLFLMIHLNAQSAPISIDGRFDDWAGVSSYLDEISPGDELDFLEFQVTNDEKFLFIRLVLNVELNLKEDDPFVHRIFLDIDTDDDPSTGFSSQEGYGAELSIDFSNRFAYFNVTPSSTVAFSDIQARFAPTVTSNVFEIAIGRNSIPDGANALFSGSTIRILFRDDNSGEVMPNEGEIFTYTFDETPVPELIPTDLEKEDSKYIRVVAYNTLFDGLEDEEQVGHFEKVIKALQPDIIGFSECNNTSAVTVRNLMNQWLPLDNEEGWKILKNGDVITASRWPYLDNWPSLYRQFPVLIDLPDDVYETDLLFTNAHLRCCGNNTDRQAQVDEYAAFILNAKSPNSGMDIPENTPFVYAGDLNLVGYSQQLTTLVTGEIQDVATYGEGGALDWDETDLTDQICRQTDKRMAYTWRNDGSSFPPGRLDFVIFSDAVMSAEKSFTLQTDVMPADRLEEYNLDSWSAEEASDHFPVTVDFSIDAVVGLPEELTLNTSVFPNPVATTLIISFEKKGLYQIEITDAFGRVVLAKEVNANEVILEVEKLNVGIYFLNVASRKGEVSRAKILIQR